MGGTVLSGYLIKGSDIKKGKEEFIDLEMLSYNIVHSIYHQAKDPRRWGKLPTEMSPQSV